MRPARASSVWARSVLGATVVFSLACDSERSTRIIDVTPAPRAAPELAGAAVQTAILATYEQVGDLHTMTFSGDFAGQIAVQHWGIMQELARQDYNRRHGCSMFQHTVAGEKRVLGRNFDHKPTEVLVSHCYPDSGFASIGFTPLNSLGFTEDTPFDPANDQHRQMLLYGPVTTVEGLNERGVCVTLASLGRHQVIPDPAKEPRFLIHLVREILDHAATIDEAVALAARYNVFDNGRDVISHHIFIGDPTGSAVLEWQEGVMQVVPDDPGGTGQIVTNSPLAGRGEEVRRDQCERYRILRQELTRASTRPPDPRPDWQQGLDALAAAAQHNARYVIDGEPWVVSTQWSTLFELSSGQAYICLQCDFDTVYRVTVPFAAH